MAEVEPEPAGPERTEAHGVHEAKIKSIHFTIHEIGLAASEAQTQCVPAELRVSTLFLNRSRDKGQTETCVGLLWVLCGSSVPLTHQTSFCWWVRGTEDR